MRLTYLLGVDVSAPDCKYNTCLPPIVAAGMSGNDDAVLFLLDRGADINGAEPRGQTALMMAAYLGHKKTVRLLLSKGAEVNARSDYGTALTWAKAGWCQDQVEIVETLQQAGARE
jgi:ankyrin repeat protein